MDIGAALPLIGAIAIAAGAIGVAASNFLYGRPVVESLKDRVAELEERDAEREKALVNETAHNAERVERIRALEARPDLTKLGEAIALLTKFVGDMSDGMTLRDLHVAIIANADRATKRDEVLLAAMQASVSVIQRLAPGHPGKERS